MKYYFVIEYPLKIFYFLKDDILIANDFAGNSYESLTENLEELYGKKDLILELEFPDNYKFDKQEIDDIIKKDYLELFL
jgi:hypothetical protein